MYRHRFITIYSCLSPVLDGEAQKLGSVLGRLETNPQHRAIFFSAHTAHSSSSSRNFVSPIRQEPSLKTSLESHYFQPPKLHKGKKKAHPRLPLSCSLCSLFKSIFSSYFADFVHSQGIISTAPHRQVPKQLCTHRAVCCSRQERLCQTQAFCSFLSFGFRLHIAGAQS